MSNGGAWTIVKNGQLGQALGFIATPHKSAEKGKSVEERDQEEQIWEFNPYKGGRLVLERGSVSSGSTGLSQAQAAWCWSVDQFLLV